MSESKFRKYGAKYFRKDLIKDMFQSKTLAKTCFNQSIYIYTHLNNLIPSLIIKKFNRMAKSLAKS